MSLKIATMESFVEMVNQNYYFKISWAKLRPPERAILESFIDHNWGKNDDERSLLINRLFLDQRDAKPRNWKHILELLSNFNSFTIRQKAVSG